jgi:2-methylcitrate dehydratase PrpD
MNDTRTLARFVAETTFADLPRRLVENLKISVLDTFGAALVGTRLPWAQRIVAMVKDLGGAPQASVIHHGWRTDVARAALANGVLIGAFECEPLTGSHASGTVLPAALAVCERERLDGVAFLTALALGFEVSARIARTAVGLETVRGFHNPGTQGPFGAAAAVGKLYGFDAERLTDALGIAARRARGSSSSRGAEATPSACIWDARVSSGSRARCSRARACAAPPRSSRAARATSMRSRRRHGWRSSWTASAPRGPSSLRRSSRTRRTSRSRRSSRRSRTSSASIRSSPRRSRA